MIPGEQSCSCAVVPGYGCKENDFVELHTAIRERRSIRHFKPDPISDETLAAIFEAGTWAPSHGNRQPWEFVILGPKTRADVAARYLAALEAGSLKKPDLPEARKAAIRAFATDFGGAPVLLAVVGQAATSDLDRYDFPLACAAAIQNILLAAWARHVGGIWLSLAVNPAIRECLEIGPDQCVAGIVAMGIPEVVPEPKPRIAVAAKIRRLS